MGTNTRATKKAIVKWLLARRADWSSCGYLPSKNTRISLVGFVKLLLATEALGIFAEFGLDLLLIFLGFFPNCHHIFELHPRRETLWTYIIGFLWDNGRWFVDVFLWDSVGLLFCVTYGMAMLWNVWVDKKAKAVYSTPLGGIVWPPPPQPGPDEN